MNTQEIVFFTIVILSFSWAVGVLLYKIGGRKIRQVITSNKYYKDNIIDNDVMAPKEFVVNLVINDKDDIDFSVFADMAIKWKELKDGTYKLPQKKTNLIEKQAKEEEFNNEKIKENPVTAQIESKANVDFMQFLNPSILTKKQTSVI